MPANVPPPERCAECGKVDPGPAACPACGFDPAAAGEVAFVTPETSPSNRGWSVAVFAVFGVGFLLFPVFVAANEPEDAMSALALGLFMGVPLLVAAYWYARHYHRGRAFAVLRARPEGWSRQLRLGPAKRWTDWPDHGFVRYEPLANGALVLIGSREAAPQTSRIFGRTLPSNQPNRRRAFVVAKPTRRTFRQIEAARAMLPLSPTFDAVDKVSHCPACGYRLAEMPQEGGGRCAECGWAWQDGETVLFGRKGPTFGKGISLGGIASGLAAGVGGGLLGAAATAGPMLLLIWAWQSLPPGYSHAAVALILVGIIAGLVAIVVKAARFGERDRDRRDRLGDASTGPPGTIALRLQKGGVHQGPFGDPTAKLTPWEKLQGCRVQRWPGGVRVRCDRRGKPHRWWRGGRPIDFLFDCADPRGEAATLRHLVGQASSLPSPADERH